MKSKIVLAAILLASSMASAQTSKLEKNIVDFARIILTADVQECMNSFLDNHNIERTETYRFYLNNVDTFTTTEQLKGGLTRTATHFILNGSGSARVSEGVLKRVGIKFNIEASTVTGILEYECSGELLQ